MKVLLILIASALMFALGGCSYLETRAGKQFTYDYAGFKMSCSNTPSETQMHADPGLTAVLMPGTVGDNSGGSAHHVDGFWDFFTGNQDEDDSLKPPPVSIEAALDFCREFLKPSRKGE